MGFLVNRSVVKSASTTGTLVQKTKRKTTAPLSAGGPEPSVSASEPSAPKETTIRERTKRRRDPRYSRIARRLIEERKGVLGMSQEDLWGYCRNLSVDTISNAENGYPIQRNNFLEIIAALNRARSVRDSLEALDGERLWVELILPGTPQSADALPPGSATLDIAYKLWCELTTRKLALALDPENDLIVEVYNSWYASFGIMRDLLKSIPIQVVAEREAALRVMELCVEIMNAGLRPHLTRWQADLRRWVNRQADLPKNRGRRMQEIERDFPRYAELREDLETANARLIEYEARLHMMVFGKGRN